MTSVNDPMSPDPQMRRLAAEERRCFVRFTCVWLASLALLGIAWLTSPNPPRSAAEPRDIPIEAGRLVASVSVLP
jgi:hypothetical protein